MKVHIIYTNFLNDDERTYSVGGVQTYILNLAEVLKRNNFEVIIHQSSNHDFVVSFEYGNVFAYKNNFLKESERNIKENELVIYGTDTYAINKRPGPTISIQHGIYWDKPMPVIGQFTKWRRKIKDYYQIITRIKRVDTLVCVDYNFVNWYRALVNNPEVRLAVIPNFCDIPESKPEKSKNISIIFARRFFDYRGTRLFASVVKRLLESYPEIKVTIAGEGPDEKYLKTELDPYKQVAFTKYAAKDSFELHKDKHIAVVPTLGSEGTSLSLLEAMSAGCCPVCTNVGGMTNIIIDHFNGLMVNPAEDEFFNAIKRLIENSALRTEMAANAFLTVKSGFNKRLWAERWISVVNEVLNRYSS